MLDSGSMACTVNEATASRMLEEKVITTVKQLDEQVLLIGCGCHQTHPKCVYEVEIEVYGVQCIVPILVVPGQKDDLILGSNDIKYIMHQMKSSDDYWRVTGQSCGMSLSPDTSQFLDMMAGLTRWKGVDTPNKIGTVKLTQAVTLLARHEHLVWGRLPQNTPMSPGSAVVVEPTSSKSMPRNILVGRVVTPMWGDRYVPMRIVNLSDQPVTLKRNCKLADVSPCMAAEDFMVFQNSSQVKAKKELAEVGLKDIDLESCQISHSVKRELVQLLISYNDIFSKHALDYGEAKGFIHRIRLMDERPFRLPYRRVPPAHYQKLRQVLTEMEDQDIIRKSTSEFASPLVMVWKKDGTSFMRMMLSIFGDMNFTQLLCYLDDLLVFAATEKEALSRLEVVFQRLRQHNLKLSPKKCHLVRMSVRFLGHIIEGGGVAVDPEKVGVISRMTKDDLMEDDGVTPSVKRVKSFLGMVFYYQHFISCCSALARPLFALTAGQKRKGRGNVPRKAGTFRKLKPSDWTVECDASFSALKEKLLNCAVLAHPDFSRPLILSIDASLDGLGAVLSQILLGEDKARPIAFVSKTLSTSQRRYPAHRLEFLALKWSVCEKFSHWLRGHTFSVWTDNNPLTYIMTKPKLDACEQRWVANHTKTLLSHLHEAATIAQQHARVKGTHLSIGDRVLIWESTLYVVINRNPQTHTYMVQDEKGEEQSQDEDCSEKFCDNDSHITVHCNVQMDCFSFDGDRAISVVETRDMPNTEQPSQEIGDRDTQGVEDTQERVTLAGRIVKKVNRLIESMAQRQLKIKSLTNTLGRRSQSLLTLF
ncbi:hypothetical protein IRJ41_024660 [Triplophysa rosa]|uniref:ribonuclease H n=1 Tax=Triplophysa rosa TaxID=992332 RepID=A0A9W7TX64_TRIRA|nr:hypothetical protein IRJ41_024660 [Triplophysa rosa]